MKRHKFKSYEEYIEKQRRMTMFKNEKIDANDGIGFSTDKVTEAIWRHHPMPCAVDRGLCHGVRKGYELDRFEKRFGGEWIGTEIVEELCDGKRIIHADFADLREDWVGKFDIVYSNSLDHARDPGKAVKAWMASLAVDGWLYVEWTKWHGRIGKSPRNVADCFAATLDEYRTILSTVGVVEDVIELRDKKNKKVFKRHIIAVH